MGVREVGRFIDELISSKKTGVLRVYRSIFQDPLIYAHFLKGIPVYAYSFVVKEKWYDGLLDKQEVDEHMFGNLFEYAYTKYGQTYIQHIVRYSQNVIKKALEVAAESMWDLACEFEDEDEDVIRQGVGIIKTTKPLVAWARTLLSVGARYVYLPEYSSFIGAAKNDDLKLIYEFMLEEFGGATSITSTPFANVFLVYKDGSPVLFATDPVPLKEDWTTLESILWGLEIKPFEKTVVEGQEVGFPKLNVIGKPFAMTFFRGNGSFLTVHVKNSRVYMLEEYKGLNVLQNMITSYNEKISMLLYQALDMGTGGLSPEMMDLRIRILLLKNPHPDDFRDAIRRELRVEI